MEDGAFHLGGDDHTEGVDPERECYPAGQGTGVIQDLVPAGQIVRDMVAEAEGILRRLHPVVPTTA
jgi:enoyl-[acyl-carrier protein] reductase II